MKRPKPPTRRAKPEKKKVAIVGLEVPAPTRAQLAKLKKVFKSKALAALGIEPSVAVTRMSFRKRSPKR